MHKPPIRVWLYARTSDERSDALENQLASLYDEAEFHGYTVVNSSTERRCAGSLNRPALFAVLKAVRDGKADAVMITGLSRFSYHWLIIYLILCFLQDHGVALITTKYDLHYILYLRGFETPLLSRHHRKNGLAPWRKSWLRRNGRQEGGTITGSAGPGTRNQS